MPTVDSHHTLGGNTIVGVSSELSTYLAPHGYHHGLWMQTQPLQGNAYDYALYQPDETLDGLPPVARNLNPSPANGYVSIREDMSLELERTGSFFRCATYQGGPARLTTNISPASSQVSHPCLSAEVCRCSVWKALWG